MQLVGEREEEDEQVKWRQMIGREHVSREQFTKWDDK